MMSALLIARARAAARGLRGAAKAPAAAAAVLTVPARAAHGARPGWRRPGAGQPSVGDRALGVAARSASGGMAGTAAHAGGRGGVGSGAGAWAGGAAARGWAAGGAKSAAVGARSYRRQGGGWSSGGGYSGGDNGGSTAFRALFLPNLAVFGAWQYASYAGDWQLERTLRRHFMCSEAAVMDGRVHTLLTAAFSHTDTIHFGINMFVMSSFLGGVAQMRGEMFAAGLCAMGGVAGCAAHVANEAAGRLYRDSRRPAWFAKEPPSKQSVVGASGGVLALAAFTAAKFPSSRVSILFAADLARALRLPALERLLSPKLRTALALFAAWELYSAMGPPAVGPFPHAHAGHLGGMAMGALAGVLA